MEELDSDCSANYFSLEDSHHLFLPGYDVIRRMESNAEQPDRWEDDRISNIPTSYYADQNFEDASNSNSEIVEIYERRWQAATVDNLRSALEKQIEALQLDLTDGQEALKQSIKKSQQQIDAIYDAIDRMEAVVADLQERYDTSQKFDSKYINVTNRLEAKYVHLFLSLWFPSLMNLNRFNFSRVLIVYERSSYGLVVTSRQFKEWLPCATLKWRPY